MFTISLKKGTSTLLDLTGVALTIPTVPYMMVVVPTGILLLEGVSQYLSNDFLQGKERDKKEKQIVQFMNTVHTIMFLPAFPAAACFWTAKQISPS